MTDHELQRIRAELTEYADGPIKSWRNIANKGLALAEHIDEQQAYIDERERALTSILSQLEDIDLGR